jgi:hypothetical protein
MAPSEVNMVALANDGRYPPPLANMAADAPEAIAIGSVGRSSG